MSEIADEPMMLFDFVNEHGNQEQLIFMDPIKIIQAHTYEEVIGALDEVDMYVKNGKYAAGYVSYEASSGFDRKLNVKKNSEIPLLYFGVYKDPLASSRSSADFKGCDDLKWTMSISKKQFYDSIQRIKEYIAEGSTYQVNYTMRLHSAFHHNDLQFYERLMRAQKSNYCAYLNLGRYRILSASPELFFELNEGIITTRPMKGTIKRGRWYEEDEKQKQILKDSNKDRAENVMIVDLLRNDLSKVAKTGSVKVPDAFTIEKYPTVYQMTSTVTAEMREGSTIVDIFKSLFPCGSITGAPKKSTMDIIAELEESPRGIYCGSIGYITPANRAIFNVAIRTVMVDSWEKRAEYGTGGGITWNSESTNEYDEALLKATVLQENSPQFELLETLKYDQGQFERLDLHMKRLIQSASYFDFAFDSKNLLFDLIAFSDSLNADQSWKVNIYLNKNGKTRITSTQYKPLNGIQKGRLAERPISRNDKYLFHKTTNRSRYDQHYREQEDCFGILLWNEENELTEFTIGNLVVKWDGRYYTPPLDCGLLPGTMREQLITDGEIFERVIHKNMISSLEEVWLINSLRGWVRINLIGK